MLYEFVGLLLVDRVDFSLSDRDGAVPKLRARVRLASELLDGLMVDLFLHFLLLLEQLLVLLHFLVLFLFLVLFFRQLR